MDIGYGTLNSLVESRRIAVARGIMHSMLLLQEMELPTKV